MAGIDSLLKMLEGQGGDVLKLATDAPPKMSRQGAPVRLSIPPTSDATLRQLLGSIFSLEREVELRKENRIEVPYTPESGGAPYTVILQAVSTPPNSLEVTFRKGAPRPGAAPPVPAPTAIPAPITHRIPVPLPEAAVDAPAAPQPVTTRSRSLDPGLVSLLAQAVERRASDVHLHAAEEPSMRVDGRLRTFEGSGGGNPETMLESLVSDSARTSLDAGRSADFALDAPGLGRFRVNLYRTRGHLAAAFRVLPLIAPTLEDLHFPIGLSDLVDSPHGLIIVAGPTGSGKSATLAALARRSLRRHALLISLEDPIEYPLEGTGTGLVRQRQVGSDVRDFSTGLRDALREDPDILLIGEMRDPETISLALTAAETGHLVLASLHSRSAASSIERIVDSYPPERQAQIRVQLADALRAVVAQRLLPRLGGGGRVPAVEVLRANHTVASLIREGKTAQIPSAIQSSRKEGMVALERCLADMVKAGQVSAEDALAVANDPAAFTAYSKT